MRSPNRAPDLRLLTAAAVCLLTACAGQLRGDVQSCADHRPLAGAHVRIHYSSATSKVPADQETTTDADGKFSIPAPSDMPRDAQFQLHTDKPGYTAGKASGEQPQSWYMGDDRVSQVGVCLDKAP